MPIPLLALPLMTALLGGGIAAGTGVARGVNDYNKKPSYGMIQIPDDFADTQDKLRQEFEARKAAEAEAEKAMALGAGTGQSYADTSAARNATLGQIGSLDTQLDNLNRTAQSQYDQLLGRYNEEDALAAAEYERQKASNENTRSSGISQSLAAAAQGGRGLRSSLAAMGALGGTGSVLANRAVAQSANKDVGGVNETFDTNAGNLNTAWSTTEQDQRNRKSEASQSLENSRLKNAGSVASQRQNLFRDMASFFEQAGNKGEAANWLSRLSGENPAIERAALTKTPEWQNKSAAFSPQALKSYLAGAQNMGVETGRGNSGLTMNSPLFAQSRRREEYA